MDAFARLSLFAMARAAADDFVDRLTGDWHAELSDMAVAGKVDRLVVFLRYTLRVNPHVDPETLRDRLLPLVGEDVEEAIMTAGEKLIQKGYEQGREQERRQLLLRWFDRVLGAATLDELFVEGRGPDREHAARRDATRSGRVRSTGIPSV